MSRKDISSQAAHAKSQAALIEFLRADIELAFTFLRTAEIEAASDPEHCHAALAKARDAVDTIRRLEASFEDREIEATLRSKRDELEAALSAWEGR